MRRKRGRATAVVALFTLLVAGAAGIGPVQAQTPTTDASFPPTPLPAAWMLVDADTGAVIGGTDIHTPRPPASTIKLLTGLIASGRLPVHDPVPISPLDESKPARKINVKAGQIWDRTDLMYSMLMVSANDAAYALAERVGGGSLDHEITIATATLARLHTSDHPIANDPAGLDDETFSNRGGSRISAWDLAIVARAARADPAIQSILTTPHYEFNGGDGLHHTLDNHDTFLSLYVGANGMKTGGTDLAGRTFVGTATRGGRTMLVVEFDAANIYASAEALLDQGFATPVAAETNLAHLPAVVPNAALDPDPVVTHLSLKSRPAAAAPVVQHHHKSLLDNRVVGVLLVLCFGLPILVVLRRRTVVRRRAARRAAARARARARAAVGSGDVPDHVEIDLTRVEDDLRWILLVDVANEAHVHAVADEFP